MNEYVKNLNRIEFVVTMACTGKCRHCSEGDHSAYTGHIDADAAVNAVYEVCKSYKIKSLMTFGGEPLLYPDVVCEIHKAATAMNIEKRSLITNGFFSRDKAQIRKTADMLAESGITGILLSVDAFHQETIPLETVKYFAECVKAAGVFISLNPAWLVGEKDGNPYNVRTREIISQFDCMDIPVREGNVIFPKGNAAKYFTEYFDKDKEYLNPYEENPKDIRTISFPPNADVLGGNVYRDSISNILENYRP